MHDIAEIRRTLNAAFAYRAEWLKGDIFSFFMEPHYFPELLTHYPCVLIGGRGTGKTTVLRGLSYHGQFAFCGENAENVRQWPSFGIYHRIDTNRVTAFAGEEASCEQWQRLFAHYFNLLLADLILEFVDWYEDTTEREVVVAPEACRRIATSLGIPITATLHGLRNGIVDALVQFEVHVNNIADALPVRLSVQGAPIDVLVRALADTDELRGKTFSFLLDEYENLDYYQQQVVNTLIKHGSDRYVFKIGIRELCWKCKTTLNVDEQLVSPADYRLIDIAAELPQARFAEFARRVCNARLRRLEPFVEGAVPDVAELFPSISLREEADLLGVKKISDEIRAKLSSSLTCEEKGKLDEMDDFDVYMVRYWAEGQSRSPSDVLREALRDPAAWAMTCGNHAYAALFTIRRGRRGIRKHYCGWDTFTHLAGSNIRYLLELVDRSLISHLAAGSALVDAVPYKVQTESAQQVGRKNLSELEGLSVYGAKLTRLLYLTRLTIERRESPGNWV